MSEKQDMQAEVLEPTCTNGSAGEKPTTEQVEDIREPYWDTKHVIGADRNIATSVTTGGKVHYGPVTRKQRLQRHLRRFWKLYLVLFILFNAVGWPVLFLVIFPAIAQRLVDNASLPISSASIMNPTPTSVEYSMVATLNVPKGVTVDLKPITLSLYTEQLGPSDPYIKVDLPEYHLEGTSTVAVTNQTATILDESQFETFLASAVNSENFTMSAEGATAAYLGHLKANINLKKNVELSGLNSLKGFSFTKAAIVFPAEADGTNLVGSVILPNPSIVTFEMGNVTLNMILGGIKVGEGRFENVLLRPGNNSVSLRATANIATLVENILPILTAQSSSLQQGNIEISASGNSTVYNGLHIPYYENTLNNLTITGEVPIVQILTDTLQTFLNSSVGQLLNGTLGSLNLTSIIDGLTDGHPNTSSIGSLIGLLTGATNSSTSSTSSSKRSAEVSVDALGSVKGSLLLSRDQDNSRVSPSGLSLEKLLKAFLTLKIPDTASNIKRVGSSPLMSRYQDNSRTSPSGLSLNALMNAFLQLKIADAPLSEKSNLSPLLPRDQDNSRTSPTGLS